MLIWVFFSLAVWNPARHVPPQWTDRGPLAQRLQQLSGGRAVIGVDEEAGWLGLPREEGWPEGKKLTSMIITRGAQDTPLFI